MDRNKLIENLNNLSDFEKLVLECYVREITDEIPDRDFNNIYIKSRLEHFYDYYSHIDSDKKHPFEYLYKKLMDGVTAEPKGSKLILHTDSYDKEYKKLATCLNERWQIDSLQESILLFLKIIVERDWATLKNKLHEGATIEEIKDNIKDYRHIIAETLDEVDLKIALLFSGALMYGD